ncbi:MAG: hypothetical protein R2706_03060 [Acidimicrobiales bacterium]
MTFITNDGFGFDRPRGYLFDVDGVVTPTAAVHQRAWKLMFEDALGAPFTEDDYLRFVDGKARVDGITAVLASRGLDLDPAEIERMATTKNELFLQVVADEGVAPYLGTQLS